MMKTYLPEILKAIGLVRIFRWLNRDKVIILFAHSVVDNGAELKWTPLRPPLDVNVFRRQIEAIARYYNFVTYQHAVDIISGRAESIPNAIAITFDDGYYNNVKYALPILHDHGIKPTFFIPTAYINNQKSFWFDRFDYVIQQMNENFELWIGGDVFQFEAGDRDRLRECYAALRAKAKSIMLTDKEFAEFFSTKCEDLEEVCGKSLLDIQATDDISGIVSEQDIRKVFEAGTATFGSHTVDHTRISRIDADACTDELTRSKDRIENIIGESCDHFCYPNGDVDNSSRALVEQAGYVSACTTEAGANPVGQDAFLIRRIHLPDRADEASLLARLSGALDIIGRVKALIQKS